MLLCYPKYCTATTSNLQDDYSDLKLRCSSDLNFVEGRMDATTLLKVNTRSEDQQQSVPVLLDEHHFSHSHTDVSLDDSNATNEHVVLDSSISNYAASQTHYSTPQPMNESSQILEAQNIDSLGEGRPRKGRKRKYPFQNRRIRKMKCVQNETYITQRGYLKEPKEFREYICSCKCLNKIGIDAVKEEFKNFYSTTSHDAQTALICAMVTTKDVKRKRVKDSNKRTATRTYTIRGVKVCKSFFLQTFRISSGKVHLAIKKIQSPRGVVDRRGLAGGRNKLPENKLREVIDHIKKFPRYKSHYRRSDTQAEFLAPEITVNVMYDMYKDEVSNSVSKASYKKIFLTKFNIKRKPLKKDTCNVCDTLEVQIQNTTGCEAENFKSKKENHLEQARIAQDMRSSDMSKAKQDGALEVLCFDLEKTLPLPRIPTNTVFYKRQLWLYNLGIRSGKDERGHCYVWLEGEAGGGSQEESSCLMKYLIEELPAVEEVILWSDSCGGQNRNIKMVLMLKAILEQHPTVKKITQRFLVPGHIFLPNDSDFGDIECALKLQQRLYTAEDYINVMKFCRKRNPLVVHRMKSEDFKSTDLLEKQIVNRKTNNLREKINWLKVKEIELHKDKPFSIFFKQEYKVEINIQKKKAEFPLQVSYATSIYKSQGQTIEFTGVNLHADVFSDGLLHVVLIGVRSVARMRVLVPCDCVLDDVGHVKNVV
ncbi:uncharacterized protein [Anabrus simplex]|uniref:uncharacterized protein n=1 Tax=Anabrus simplex TaxID=316456 RepID=UPI0035A2A329